MSLLLRLSPLTHSDTITASQQNKIDKTLLLIHSWWAMKLQRTNKTTSDIQCYRGSHGVTIQRNGRELIHKAGNAVAYRRSHNRFFFFFWWNMTDGFVHLHMFRKHIFTTCFTYFNYQIFIPFAMSFIQCRDVHGLVHILVAL